MGAGLLPICIYKNKIYFLFGKENYTNDTPGWSDFGGGREKNETDIETASREGAEELNGFLLKPTKWIKGTKMAYAGLRKENDRASVIKYLNENSDNPLPLP